jgi:hypothetical protein
VRQQPAAEEFAAGTYADPAGAVARLSREVLGPPAPWPLNQGQLSELAKAPGRPGNETQQQEGVQPSRSAAGPWPVDQDHRAVRAQLKVVRPDIGVHERVAG